MGITLGEFAYVLCTLVGFAVYVGVLAFCAAFGWSMGRRM